MVAHGVGCVEPAAGPRDSREMRQQARLKGILGGTNTVGATTSSVPEQQQQQPAVVAKTSSSVDADDCNASASDASGLIVPERRTRSERYTLSSSCVYARVQLTWDRFLFHKFLEVFLYFEPTKASVN